jgi:GGDEF domain-containing protein
MPVFLLVGVLVVSVAANALLLLWLSQAEHVTLHWPRSMQDGPVFSRADRPSGRAAASGRRSLFVAGDPATSAASAERQAPARVPVQSDRPIADTLPPSLADLLSGTAPLSPAPSSVAPGFSGEPDVPRGPRAALVRLAAAGGQASLAIDALTGVENAEGWSRIMEIENARLLRYRRPSTVVLAEIDGLRRLADEVGEDPALRLLPVVADAFRREARSSDWVARIGYGRFAAVRAE